MSEELAEYKSGDITTNETGGLVPRSFDGLWRMSQIMAQSGLMPKGIEKPESVFVAVQMGMEVGLSPMQAVQNIAPINGRPAIWGDAMLGLVRASGLMEEFKETAVGTFPNDNYAAVCTVKRKGFDSVTQTFSIADAKKAGLWGKSGPWQQYPKRMLQMRARSWALRDAFGDVLKGLRCAEEVMDYVEMHRDESGAYSFEPTPPETAVEETGQGEGPDKTTEEAFAGIVKERGHDLKKVEQFVEATAQANNKSADDVKEQALQYEDRFFASYEKYMGKNGNGQAKQQDPEATFRDEWIKMRTNGYYAYVWKNLERFRQASAEIVREAREKWNKFYDEPFPLDIDADAEAVKETKYEPEPEGAEQPAEPEQSQEAPFEPDQTAKSAFQQWDEIQQKDEAGAVMALEAAGFDNEPGTEQDLKKCVDAYNRILNQGQTQGEKF